MSDKPTAPLSRLRSGAARTPEGRPHTVAVVGPAEPPDERLVELARVVGRGLAAERVVVVSGGLGGVMEAACQGAKEAGGLTVGLLPGDDPSAANPWVDVAVPTGLGQARNVVLVRTAQALVAVGGSWGTMSEVAHARRAGVPVVGLGSWSVRDEQGREVPGQVRARDAAHAVELAVAAADAHQPDA